MFAHVYANAVCILTIKQQLLVVKLEQRDFYEKQTVRVV